MGDSLEEVLHRHREIWRERLWYGVVVACCFGAVVGYMTRALFG
jgi:hypothetical protein